MDAETGWIASGIAAAVFLVTLASAVHALLQRRETGAVIAWVGLIFPLPLAGSIFYWLFGINRTAGAPVPCVTVTALRRPFEPASRWIPD